VLADPDPGAGLWLAQTRAEPSYQVVEHGPFYRVWSRTVQETNATTGKVQSREQRYMELANCLNYWENGEWKDSQDLIELAPDGAAIAQHGQVKVIFSPNLNTAGAIDLLSPQGKRFRSHILGLYYLLDFMIAGFA
jgi:hypothetical protein